MRLEIIVNVFDKQQYILNFSTVWISTSSSQENKMEDTKHQDFLEKIDEFRKELESFEGSGHSTNAKIRDSLRAALEGITSLLFGAINIVPSAKQETPKKVGPLESELSINNDQVSPDNMKDEPTEGTSSARDTPEYHRRKRFNEIITFEEYNKGIIGDAALLQPMNAYAFNSLYENFPDLKQLDVRDILGPLKSK